MSALFEHQDVDFDQPATLGDVVHIVKRAFEFAQMNGELDCTEELVVSGAALDAVEMVRDQAEQLLASHKAFLHARERLLHIEGTESPASEGPS